MTHAIIVTLAALGVVGQVAVVGLVAVALLAAVGVDRPLLGVRSAVWGYELWLVVLMAAIATLGSLFFSEIAHFIPCKLCWFQRIFMYPLAAVAPLMALARDHRAARYLLPLPVLGAGVSVYHILVERGVVAEAHTCLISAPGGCTTKWIDELGYITIPTLALTGFLLCFALLVIAVVNHPAGDGAGDGDG